MRALKALLRLARQTFGKLTDQSSIKACHRLKHLEKRLNLHGSVGMIFLGLFTIFLVSIYNSKFLSFAIRYVNSATMLVMLT